MDDAHGARRAYIRSLPADDRVMLVRADALATPATAFEPNRRKSEEAIAASAARRDGVESGTGLRIRAPDPIPQRGAGRAKSSSSGPDASAERESLRLSRPPNAEFARPAGQRRSPRTAACARSACGDRRPIPAVWEIYVSVRNYGAKPRTVSLALLFGGAAGRHAHARPRAGNRAGRRCSSIGPAPPGCWKPGC